jgi:HSP20 family protein
MAIVRYHPFRSLQEDINRLFEGSMGDWKLSADQWYPSVDITENATAFIVKAELPGVSADDVKITMRNNELTLYGEKKMDEASKNDHYYRCERSYGTFQRSFSFPSSVHAEDITASYKDGVLTVTLKKAEEAKPKQILIATAPQK